MGCKLRKTVHILWASKLLVEHSMSILFFFYFILLYLINGCILFFWTGLAVFDKTFIVNHNSYKIFLNILFFNKHLQTVFRMVMVSSKWYAILYTDTAAYLYFTQVCFYLVFLIFCFFLFEVLKFLSVIIWI